MFPGGKKHDWTKPWRSVILNIPVQEKFVSAIVHFLFPPDNNPQTLDIWGKGRVF